MSSACCMETTLASRYGIEPQPTDLETVMLPLHQRELGWNRGIEPSLLVSQTSVQPLH